RRQMEKLDEYLAACQLGITIASLALGALGEPTIAGLIEPALHSALAANVVAVIATVTALLAMTALHITVGEQAPKSFAIGSAERVSALCAWPLELFHRSLRPLVLLLNAISNGLVRMVGGRPATSHGDATVEELRQLIAGLATSGRVDADDARMLRGVITLDERRASEIMTPRSRLVSARSDQTIEEALALSVESGHSRLPLVDAEDGELLGVVFARDLTAAHLAGRGAASVTNFRHDMLITPESQRVDVLLDRMRDAHASIAGVLDEYGTLVGVVTVEDILEEIVGEIQDESDRPSEIRTLANGTVIAPGDAPVRDLAEHGFDLPGDAETIAGVVHAELGRIPQRGDRITAGNADVRVLAMDGHRIKRLRLRRRPSSQPREPAG
ncbi:MAG: magnesium and cobalt exporter, family, partial [Gaiellales bacterium]|nr:magnesium and cobalt exporter, family [Gaiellales bacterium]